MLEHARLERAPAPVLCSKLRIARRAAAVAGEEEVAAVAKERILVLRKVLHCDTSPEPLPRHRLQVPLELVVAAAAGEGEEGQPLLPLRALVRVLVLEYALAEEQAAV